MGKFFQDYPQIIGMSGDLPEPNSFITINDYNAPIIAQEILKESLEHFIMFVLTRFCNRRRREWRENKIYLSFSCMDV